MINVCFIIVTYNSQNYIRRCIDSILFYEPESGIIVVDNNSIDSTVDILLEYNKVNIIVSRKNLGFGKGNNLGIERAIEQKYDYVFLLNDDAFLVESLTMGMVNIFKSNLQLGILSPIQLDIEGHQLEQKFEYFLTEQGKIDEINDRLLNKNANRDLLEVEFCQAAAWMLPTALLKEIGNFNPLFFQYGEDNELANRLRYVNYKIGIAVNFRIRHRGNPRAVFYAKNFNSYHRNRKISKWINNGLNLNKEYSLRLVFRESVNLLKLSFSHVFLFKIKEAIGVLVYLVSILSLHRSINSNRQNLSKTLLKFTGQ